MRLLETGGAETPPAAPLHRLAVLVEDHCQGGLCGIMGVSEDGRHLDPMAGPSLPAAHLAAIDGTAVRARAGSCGTACCGPRTRSAPGSRPTCTTTRSRC